ncbi:putative transcriptional regulator, TraR/DksA family [Sulfurimonas gotlandica GD1]|jgi:DnaK suppressor protein|uniref:Putative transcriptional regulator, TraR/DksA family n=1 Tax=Sulfurimonas gotlandica (strain DSM 19862 / JCM 16533 / GD1) TaxID=929558 RepID=B6BP36_SULGG|nr:TraR/DksA C4-type zinc finger protein [Sulfurimonas gotlandica]EDZ61144.1 transcriptional regulator, TraR/DksA family [Sulfurimonas gotlandica GD1]EHP30926.1 putative transcriptional regulator, TraR/DksA family [Sulfurimonas gotlandica GD1]
MTKEQRQKIKEKIIQDLDAMQKEIDELQDKIKPIAPDCSLGRLTRQEMMQEQQVNEHALHEAQIRVNKLKYAIQKIGKDGYGICAECEEEIIFGRLMLLPESTHCVACISQLNR